MNESEKLYQRMVETEKEARAAKEAFIAHWPRDIGGKGGMSVRQTMCRRLHLLTSSENDRDEVYAAVERVSGFRRQPFKEGDEVIATARDGEVPVLRGEIRRVRKDTDGTTLFLVEGGGFAREYDAGELKSRDDE